MVETDRKLGPGELAMKRAGYRRAASRDQNRGHLPIDLSELDPTCDPE